MDEPRFRRIGTNGITLNVAVAGPASGPPLILLHGFPEFWYGWRHQLGAMAEAGYRVIAPDQRGYNRSDKPKGVKAYRLDTLVDDLIGLMDALAIDRASVAGHDWGGLVAWRAALVQRERFDRMIILNAPCPESMLRELKENPLQLLRSGYTFLFQLPMLPEAILRSGDWRRMIRGMEQSSRPGLFGPEEFDHYRAAWSEPGALTSMLHWYRAGFRHRPAATHDPIVRVPTLILWGLKDRFLEAGVARSSFALCDDARIEWFDGATHWLHHEEPERVNRLVLEFLAESGSRTRGSARAPSPPSSGPSGD